MHTNNASDKFEVEQMVRVGVTGWVNHVGDTIARRHREQSVHRIKNLSRYDHIPFTQQTASILTLFVCTSESRIEKRKMAN